MYTSEKWSKCGVMLSETTVVICEWRLLLSPNSFRFPSASCLSWRIHGKQHKVARCVTLPAAPSLPSYKWRLLIAYDGTKFSGWQYQESIPTIQCLIERALMRITKLERRELCLVGASRTDKGVHAWGQAAHFVAPFLYDSLESLHAALNGLFPSEIRVREVSAARPEFHARFSSKSKIYHHKIYNHPVMNPFECKYAYHSAYSLNSSPMKEAAKYFIGKHDFSAFENASRNDREVNPVKEILRVNVVELGSMLQIEFEGTGFLYRQVRNMVALLIQIGKEALPPDVVVHILATCDHRELAKYALPAPPQGLCLMSINYGEDLLLSPPDFPSTSFGRNHSMGKCKLPYY